uniref:Uncharacterized protein n=1 Tax=Cyprinus carpio TaxID=7962 RepID=A0A8C1M8N5_CYPCA
MLSLDPPSDKKDLSFAPLSSTTSTSTTNTEEEGSGTYKERKWIVNESNLMQLFTRCPQCGQTVIDTKKFSFGSLLRVSWECINGHEGSWNSCNETRGMADNNLLVAASTLFTGATYVDIADWAACLNVQIPQKTTFYAIQSSYLIPVVDVFYKEQQAKLLEDLRLQNVLQKGANLSGDGRSDSPGFSAKYCTYSMMDDVNKNVVHFELVQVTEATSSVAMEPVAFKRCVDFLLDSGLKVDVITTDRSPSIRKTMRVDYPRIQHEFDIWHGSSKKCCQLQKKKENQDLQPWIKSICNHLWYACLLTEKWKSLLHHICGVHRWTEDGRRKECDHDDLSPDQQRRKRWLKKESPSFRTLSMLVLNPSLLKDLRQMVYHSVLLKYCRKNLHFHYSSMAARTQLAVIDHNENVNREQATTSSGKYTA